MTDGISEAKYSDRQGPRAQDCVKACDLPTSNIWVNFARIGFIVSLGPSRDKQPVFLLTLVQEGL